MAPLHLDGRGRPQTSQLDAVMSWLANVHVMHCQHLRGHQRAGGSTTHAQLLEHRGPAHPWAFLQLGHLTRGGAHLNMTRPPGGLWPRLVGGFSCRQLCQSISTCQPITMTGIIGLR